MNRRTDELAFERIKTTLIAEGYTDNDALQDLAIIEGSLKDYFRRLKEDDETTKKLKVLEIIKEKRVDVCYFMNCKTLEEYNDDVLASYAYDEVDAEQRMLTQEEYNLLKEILL